MPNAFAFVMLAVWPLVTIWLWRRFDPARALIWTILGGYLILPPLTVINLPVVPDLDKASIPSLMALVCVLFVRRDTVSFWPEGLTGKALLCVFLLSPFATVLTNGDPLYFELNQIQGMRIYNSVAAVANQGIALLPFFLARRYLAGPEAMRALLGALVAAGVAYSIPMLIESRFSPQMNVWFYGFFQHDFFQTIRFGGYRPVVFLQHGLWVAFFTLMCVLSALILLRQASPEARPKALVALLYLLFMLYICKSAGVVIYAVLLGPLLLLLPPRWLAIVAAVLAVLVLAYPALRGLHVVPLDKILAFAQDLSPDRAYSLQFRIRNEEMLLLRAEERPWFGWGGYGRNFLHDPVTGESINIADGAWIIILGIYGWLGYMAEFGLTALPLLLIGRESLRDAERLISPVVAGVGMILAANLLDLLPNATHVPLTWLVAGALMGEAERLARVRAAQRREDWQSGLHGGRAAKTVI